MLLAVAGPGYSSDKDPQLTGLPELTPQELQWQNKHHKRLKRVQAEQDRFAAGQLPCA